MKENHFKKIIPIKRSEIYKKSHLPVFLYRESRIVLDLAGLILKWPALLQESKGNGEPVMVLPGFLTSDKSTALLRKYLSYLNYQVQGWGMGMNHGRVAHLMQPLQTSVMQFADQTGQKVRLIGWSLGGYLARELAREDPQMVHSVVTLGSPLFAGPDLSVAVKFHQREGVPEEVIAEELRQKNQKTIRVPIHSIYSKSDGVVGWASSIDHNAEHQVRHHEIKSSHFGFGYHAEVYRLLARILSANSDSENLLAKKGEGD